MSSAFNSIQPHVIGLHQENNPSRLNSSVSENDLGKDVTHIYIDDLWRQRINIALGNCPPSLREAMMSRYCLGSLHRPVWQEVGQAANRTRERMRQLEIKLSSNLQSVTLTTKEREFLEYLESLLPNLDSEISRKLQETGWIKDTWGLQGIRNLYELVDVEIAAQMVPSAKGLFWMSGKSSSGSPDPAAISSLLRERCGIAEAVSKSEADAIVRQAYPHLPDEAVQLLLDRTPHFTPSEDGKWLVRDPKSTRRSRLHNASLLALSVGGPMDPATLWEGVRRCFAARGEQPPSLELAKVVWQTHSAYTWTVDNSRPDAPVISVGLAKHAPAPRPSKAECSLIEILRKHKALTRPQLLALMNEKGIPVATTTTTLSFSPIAEPVPGARGWWRLRGTAATKNGATNATPTQGKSRAQAVLQADDKIEVTFVISPISTGLVHIPAADGAPLRGKTFKVNLVGVDGRVEALNQQIKVNSAGTSWGYRPTLSIARRQHQQSEAAVKCTADFDLETETVSIRFSAA